MQAGLALCRWRQPSHHLSMASFIMRTHTKPPHAYNAENIDYAQAAQRREFDGRAALLTVRRHCGEAGARIRAAPGMVL